MVTAAMPAGVSPNYLPSYGCHAIWGEPLTVCLLTAAMPLWVSLNYMPAYTCHANRDVPLPSYSCHAAWNEPLTMPAWLQLPCANRIDVPLSSCLLAAAIPAGVSP